MTARDRLLDKYSAKVYKNRKQHVLEVDQDGKIGAIVANTRAVPGVITERGCCYSGCKGVVMGPLKDACIITHGPIGCGFYTWGTRRNKATPDIDGRNFTAYCFSTDMQESDIVFGGEKKLAQAIDEAVDLFKPKVIMIAATCPIGLIGDDMSAVAKQAEQRHGIQVLSFSCEGYKGVSQSGGHHIANNGVMRYVIGTGDEKPKTKFSVNILGDYNIGGDVWEERRILEKCGIELHAVFTGDGTWRELKSSHNVHLNVVMCHRSINYVAEMMKTKYGIDWIKVNFIGIDATCKTLRQIARYFNDAELTKRVEDVIKEELAAIADDIAYYKSKLNGKVAGILAGGSRSHHYKLLLDDFGVETAIVGYEFGHRDDYEGREIIPEIKEDADSKNIESITVSKDENHYREIYTEAELEELKKGEDALELDTYDGMFPDLEAGTVVLDDYNHFETDSLLKIVKPDILLSGVKDKYAIQKAGVMTRQIHSYDYSGPYTGFKGAVIFGHDMVMSLYTNAWGLVTPPWAHTPILVGSVAEDTEKGKKKAKVGGGKQC